MAKLSNGMTEQSLSTIFAWIESNELALPELQRPSVWGSSKVPRLISSVYLNYPFGIFLIWTPVEDDRIQCRPFRFQTSKTFDSTLSADHYLIDGQQRLTSFFRALHQDGDLNVAFNIRTEQFALPDAKIRSMMANPIEHCWYDLRWLLSLDIASTAELFKSHADLGQEHLEQIIGKNGRLNRLNPENISISFYNINRRSYGEVADIFERINLGTPVKTSQIVLGKLSAIYRGIVSDVEKYLEATRRKNGSQFDLDLIINAFSAVSTGYIDIDGLEKRYIRDRKPTPEQVLKDLQVTKESLDSALSFVGERLYIDTMKYFAKERTLICLAFLFSQAPAYLTHDQNALKIAYWAALSAISGHHDDMSRTGKDIQIIRENKDSDNLAETLLHQFRHSGSAARIQWYYDALADMERPISRNSNLMGFLYGLIRWKKAESFLSRDPIKTMAVDDSEDEEETVTESTVNPEAIHEHHIYPASQLWAEEEDGDKFITKAWIYDLGNFTFLTAKDNIRLKDPKIDYLMALSPEMKERHLIDPTKQFREKQYVKFLKNRRLRIRDALKAFLAELASMSGFPSPENLQIQQDPTDK